MTDDSTMEIYRKENAVGVLKQYVRVSIGTAVIEMPRRYRNPLTDRTHDLTKLSDTGYLKPFLALHYATPSDDIINLRSTPVLSFDRDKWAIEEHEEAVFVKQRDPNTEFGTRLLGEVDDE